MTFIRNATSIARSSMESIEPFLADRYATLVGFLARHPEFVSKPRKRSLAVGSREYIEASAKTFAATRQPRLPATPTTIPDDIVSLILRIHYGLAVTSLERAKREHLQSMAAENFVGELLERYLAVLLEPIGWVWCSNAMIKATDFVLPPNKSTEEWQLLQVKNRDNSENSSSSAIRENTTLNIKHWFRTFSRTGRTNWENFPDSRIRDVLSDQGFRQFVEDYFTDNRLS